MDDQDREVIKDQGPEPRDDEDGAAAPEAADEPRRTS